MPRTGLTSADIASAYDALVDAGLQPSIRAIRERLGNTGSLKTIADHVRALKAERWQAPGPALPDPLLQSLVSGAAEFWSELAEAADAHIEANTAQCNQQLDVMRGERDEALRGLAAMRDELSAHKAHVATLETQLAESTNRQQASNETIEALQEQIGQSQTQLHTLEASLVTRTHERDDALRVSVESEQSMDALQIQMLEKERQRQDMLTTHDQATEAMSSELNEVKAALSSARQSLEQWQSLKDRWEQDRDSLTSQVGKLQNTTVSDQNIITELQNAMSKLQSENSALSARLDVTRSMTSEAEKQQQAMLKTLSAEFAVVVREAHSLKNKSSDNY